MHKSTMSSVRHNEYWQQPMDAGMLGCRLQSRARKCLQNKQWSFAVRDYAAALEVADTMLNVPESQRFALERYLRTALELIYACRKQDPSADVSALIDTTRQRIQPLLGELPTQTMTAPLVDIAFSAIGDVDAWMDMLLSADQSASEPH